MAYFTDYNGFESPNRPPTKEEIEQIEYFRNQERVSKQKWMDSILNDIERKGQERIKYARNEIRKIYNW